MNAAWAILMFLKTAEPSELSSCVEVEVDVRIINKDVDDGMGPHVLGCRVDIKMFMSTSDVGLT